MADVELYPPAANTTLALTPPFIQTAEYVSVRAFALGGAGRVKSTRTFQIVYAAFTVKSYRYFRLISTAAVYSPNKTSVDTTLSAAAGAGATQITLASAVGISPGMVLHLRPPYGERAVVATALRGSSVVTLTTGLRRSYASGTRVTEANLSHPGVSVFDKRGVLLGVIGDAEITQPPQLGVNAEGAMQFRVPRNSPDRGLIADDRIVVIGNSVGAPKWAGVIKQQDWSEGQGQVSADDLLTEMFRTCQVELYSELPDNTLASTVAQMIVDEANRHFGEDGQVRWLVDATGSKVYRGDVDYLEDAAAALEDLRQRAGVETSFRIEVAKGRLLPYLVVRDVTQGYRGVTLTDGPDAISYRDAVLRHGTYVTAYWRFGDSAGTTAADELGASNATWAVAPTARQVGALRNDLDTAVNLNGSTQYATATVTLDGTKPFSIVMWVKRSSAPGSAAYLVSQPATGVGVTWTAAGLLDVVKVGTGTWLATSAAWGASDGTWRHLAVTYDGAMGRIYLDGAEVAVGVPAQTLVSQASLTIGRYHGISQNYHNGNLDELALFSKALMPEDVLGMFSAGRGASVDQIGNIVSTPRVMRDPGEKINAVTMTGIETQIGNLLPDWARWAVREISPTITVAIDTSGLEERRVWDTGVSVEWSLSKAKQQELADLTLDKLKQMYSTFIKAWHDRYGRPWHEGWVYEGPPENWYPESMTKVAYHTRLQLVEYPVEIPASVVMASDSTSKVNADKWIIVKYDRVNATKSVHLITPSAAAGIVYKATFAAGTYTLYKVAGSTYTGTQSVTFGAQTTYECAAANGTYYNANLPAVTNRYGGYNIKGGVYKADSSGTRVRTRPYLTAPVVRSLSAGAEFTVRQMTEVGSRVYGTRKWYGDASGTRWVKKELLTYKRAIQYAPKVLRRITEGPYAGLYVGASVTGVTFSSVASNSTYKTPDENNPIISKVYAMEWQRIHLWDPRRDGVGELVKRHSVFNGQITERRRWSIVSWAEGQGRTTLLRGITNTSTTILIESWLDLAIGETDGVYLQVGEGSAREVVLVTAQDGYELTVTRGQQGTTAIIHEAGETVQLTEEPSSWAGFEFPYYWPEGEVAARDYLDRVRKDVVRYAVTVAADTPTDIGRVHRLNITTEGQGAPYDDVVLTLDPTGYWTLDENAAFDEILDSGAVDGWWPLNDPVGSSTMLDLSPTAIGLAVNGNPVLASVAGPLMLPDVAPVLDGTGDYFASTNSAHVASTGSITVGCWVKTTMTTNATLAAKNNGTTGWSLQIGPPGAGRVRWLIGAGTDVADAPMAINDGSWHLVVGVLDRGQNRMRLYIDGMLVAADTSVATTDLSYNGEMQVGTALVGSVAHVFIERAAMSEAQIETLYRAGASAMLWDGTSSDLTGRGNNAVVASVVTPGFPGPVSYQPRNSGMASPDAGAGQLNVTHNAVFDFASSSFSVSAWVRLPDTPVNPQRLFGKGSPIGNAGAGWVVDASGTGTVTPTLYIGDGAANVNAPAGAATRGKWTLYTWVVDRARGQVFPYTNGVLGSLVSVGAVGSVSSASDLTILAGQGQRANGVVMAHVAVWARALSQDEVTKLYVAASGSEPQPIKVDCRVIGMALNEMTGENELLLEAI